MIRRSHAVYSLVSTLIIGVLLALAALPTAAAAAPAPTPTAAEQLQAARERKVKVEQTIRLMERHLRIAPDGTIALDARSAAQIGADQELFGQLVAGLNQTNARLRAGTVRLANVKLQTVPREVRLTPAAAPPARSYGGEITAFDCAGRSGEDYTWFGVTYYLNHCQVEELVATLGGGGAVCALVFAPCAVLGGIATIGAGALAGVEANGGDNGLYFNFYGDPEYGPSVPFFFWHQ